MPSGIDVARTPVVEELGVEAAQLTQLVIEYDPVPRGSIYGLPISE